MNKLILGDCKEVLKTLEDNSIDSVVTDPPYELGFMGKAWDKSGIAYDVNMWKECLRVLKPGGHLLAFGGTRTYHRMACAIEDAGFEIRDQIQWIYGSGFPKSLNIGKAVDKLQGNERKITGGYMHGGTRKSGILGKDLGQVWHENTKGTSEWEGFGTALKPANEPICLARKPLSEKTIAENVLKWGTGGLNIDECRVELDGTENLSAIQKGNIYGSGEIYGKAEQKHITSTYKSNGRFPANVIHDGSEEVIREFPNVKTGTIKKGNPNSQGLFGSGKSFIPDNPNGGDSGSASRYFFKADGCNMDFFTYLYKVIKSEIQCGSILESQKVGGIVYGVIQVVEQCIQNAEQFMYGNKSMVNFQKDMKFITETLIKQMIELKTCNCLQGMNIEWYMQEQEKTINLLMELNIEDVNYAENIKYLMNFHCEMLELIRVIVNNVQIKSYKNGEREIEKNTINIIENTERNSRIIYTPKASKSERNKGCENLELKKGGMRSETSGQHITRRDGRDPMPVHNNHPTIKPISLMSYLCRLITPPKGIILDPFMGSGSTGIAAKLNSFSFIGIEQNKHYFKIADARIEAWKPESKINSKFKNIQRKKLSPTKSDYPSFFK